MPQGEPRRSELVRQLARRVAPMVAEGRVERPVDPGERRDEQQQPAARPEQRAHHGEGALVVPDVLEHVQADDGIEPLVGERPVHGRQVQPGDLDVGAAGVFLAQARQVVGLGVGENDALAVKEKIREVADAGADFQHVGPDPAPQPVEHPAVVARGRGEPFQGGRTEDVLGLNRLTRGGPGGHRSRTC